MKMKKKLKSPKFQNLKKKKLNKKKLSKKDLFSKNKKLKELYKHSIWMEVMRIMKSLWSLKKKKVDPFEDDSDEDDKPLAIPKKK